MPGINWLRSPLVRAANRALAAASHLAVFSPAFALVAVRTGSPAWLVLYWRLILTCAVGYLAAAFASPRLETLAETPRRRAAAGLSMAGLFLLWPLVGHQVAGQTDLQAALPIWLLAGAGVWLYGLGLGSRADGHQDIQRRLVLGALLLGGTLTVAGADVLAPGFAPFAAPLILLWATGSIVALALTRLLETADAATGGPDVGSFWPPMLIAIALGCVLVALVLSLAAGPVTAVLARPVAALLRLAVMALGYMAAGLLYLLQWVVHKLLSRVDRGLEPPPAPIMPDFDSLLPEQVARELSPALIQAAKTGASIALVAAATAVGIYLLLRRNWRAPDKQVTEVRESFASAQAMRSWGGKRWRRLLAGLRRGAGHLTGRSEPASATAAYSQLLRQAARVGHPRPPAVTPHRFQPELERLWPGTQAHTQAILTAFAAEYYGGEGHGARWPEVRPHWQALRASGGSGERGAVSNTPASELASETDLSGNRSGSDATGG